MLARKVTRPRFVCLYLSLLMTLAVAGCDSAPEREDGNPQPQITGNCTPQIGTAVEARTPVPLVVGPPPVRCNFGYAVGPEFEIREQLWTRSDTFATSTERQFSAQVYEVAGDSRVDVVVTTEGDARGQDVILLTITETTVEADAINALIGSGQVVNGRDVYRELDKIRFRAGRWR